MSSNIFYNKEKDYLNPEELRLDATNRKEIKKFCIEQCSADSLTVKGRRFRKVLCSERELEFDKVKFLEKEKLPFWKRKNCFIQCQQIFNECNTVDTEKDNKNAS